MPPVRSTPWPSRTISIRRSDVGQRAGRRVDVGDEQADRVGAAVDGADPDGCRRSRRVCRHPSPSARPVRRVGRAAGAAATSRRACSSASSPSGLTPGPGGQRVRDEDVQALDPGRHAAGGDPVDLGHVAELGAAREVVVVRGSVALARDRRRASSRSVISFITPGVSRVLDRAPVSRGQVGVVRRRERRAVGQPGLGARRRRARRTGSGARPRRPRGPGARAGARRRRGRPR